MRRPEVSEKNVRLAATFLLNETLRKMKPEDKGPGSFASSHEIVGILDEEVREFKDAVHNNDPLALLTEMADIGVVAIFGLACQMQDALDWPKAGEEFAQLLSELRSLPKPHEEAQSPGR